MAKYEGVFACGHSGNVYVTGKMSERQWKIDRMFEEDCPECKKKKIVEKIKKSFKESEKNGFPKLSGSLKQIQWANSIRIDFYNQWKNEYSWIGEIIKENTEAKFWIDYRNKFKDKDFVLAYHNKMDEEKQKTIKLNNSSIEPKKILHDGIVEIYEEDKCVCLKYKKDKDFIDIVRNKDYQWSQDYKCWYKHLSKYTGKFEDRAAEVGHLLLNSGFIINIENEEICKNAISGKFGKDMSRRIIPFGDSRIEIVWGVSNSSLYNQAMLINNAKWNGFGAIVVVDESNADKIKEFAKKNNFVIEKNAVTILEKFSI